MLRLMKLGVTAFTVPVLLLPYCILMAVVWCCKVQKFSGDCLCFGCVIWVRSWFKWKRTVFAECHECKCFGLNLCFWGGCLFGLCRWVRCFEIKLRQRFQSSLMAPGSRVWFWSPVTVCAERRIISLWQKYNSGWNGTLTLIPNVHGALWWTGFPSSLHSLDKLHNPDQNIMLTDDGQMNEIKTDVYHINTKWLEISNRCSVQGQYFICNSI